jgi:alpha-tubulin suppressor-like RCC1 family protein
MKPTKLLLLAGLATVSFASLAPAASAASATRWGSYNAGKEETGPSERQNTPAPFGLDEVTMVQASNSSSYALLADGSVWASGDGGAGQLGDGARESSSTPVRVAFPKGTVITTIGEAKNEGYAIDSAGHAWTWGAGAVASSCMPGKVHSKPVVIPGLTGAVAVQGGQNHVLWLTSEGTVLGCGSNSDGQLGLGEEVGVAKRPTIIPGLSSIVQISSGNRTLEARDSSGRVFMAGENTSGQIGIGSSEEDVWTPTLVSLPEPAVNISAGGDLVPNGTSFAITAGGVYGWGADEHGQVGDRQRTAKRSPVDTGLQFASVASGGAFALGLDSEGNLYSWGSNNGGALGTGRRAGKSLTPRLVERNVAAMSATAGDAMALSR